MPQALSLLVNMGCLFSLWIRGCSSVSFDDEPALRFLPEALTAHNRLRLAVAETIQNLRMRFSI